MLALSKLDFIKNKKKFNFLNEKYLFITTTLVHLIYLFYHEQMCS